MVGHRKVLLNTYPSTPVRFRVEPFAGWGWANPSGPDNRFAVDALLCHDNARFVDMIDVVPQTHLYAKFFQMVHRGCRKALGKRSQHARTSIDQYNPCRCG